MNLSVCAQLLEQSAISTCVVMPYTAKSVSDNARLLSLRMPEVPITISDSESELLQPAPNDVSEQVPYNSDVQAVVFSLVDAVCCTLHLF